MPAESTPRPLPRYQLASVEAPDRVPDADEFTVRVSVRGAGGTFNADGTFRGVLQYYDTYRDDREEVFPAATNPVTVPIGAGETADIAFTVNTRDTRFYELAEYRLAPVFDRTRETTP